jgi:hypothetical protein
MQTTSRRGFLGALLACAVAPAFVRAESLMPVRQIILPEQDIIVPEPMVFEPATIQTTGAFGLAQGDIITIAGYVGTFVITSAVTEGRDIDLKRIDPGPWCEPRPVAAARKPAKLYGPQRSGYSGRRYG